MNRRAFVKMSASVGIVGISGCSGGGGNAAGDYPNNTITGVIPFGAGGSTDVLSRNLFDYWEQELGVTISPDNRPGAGGRLGTNYVNSQDPDGNTILSGSLPTVILGEIVTNTKYTYSRGSEESMTPIGTVGDRPTALCTAADSFEDFEGFVSWAQENDHTYASPGTGTSVDFGYTLMMDELNCEFSAVTYDDSTEQLTAVARGDADTCYLDPQIAKGFQEDGRVDIQLIGQRGQPHPVVPDVPTFDDISLLDGMTAYKYQLSTHAPPGLPEEHLDVLESTLQATVENSDYQSEIEEGGLIPRKDGNEATWDLIEGVQEGGERYLEILEEQGRSISG